MLLVCVTEYSTARTKLSLSTYFHAAIRQRSVIRRQVFCVILKVIRLNNVLYNNAHTLEFLPNVVVE
jgi:hypothetical protein